MGFFGILGILMKVSAYIPTIINIYKSIEEVWRGILSGPEKLETAQETMAELLNTTDEPDEVKAAILAAMPGLAKVAVKTFNKTGEFKKSEPNPEVKPFP